MGGSNFGRSHEPQQCGGAHVSNTLSSPHAALAGGMGDRQNTASPMTHTPKSRTRYNPTGFPPPQYPRHTRTPTAPTPASGDPGGRGEEPYK